MELCPHPGNMLDVLSPPCLSSARLSFSLMVAFHRLVDLVQSPILIAVVSRTLLIASWYHAASCSTFSAMYSASRWALSFGTSIHSFSAFSMFSSIIAAMFHHTSLSWSASCLCMSTSHSITSLSDLVEWLSASMNHVVGGWWASIRLITNSPSWRSLVRWWVALDLFPISSPFSSGTSSQNEAYGCTWHPGSHCMVWDLKSPVRTAPPSWKTLC